MQIATCAHIINLGLNSDDEDIKWESLDAMNHMTNNADCQTYLIFMNYGNTFEMIIKQLK